MLTDKQLGYEPGIKGSNPFENMKKERFYSSPFLYLYFQQSDIWYPRSLSALELLPPIEVGDSSHPVSRTMFRLTPVHKICNSGDVKTYGLCD